MIGGLALRFCLENDDVSNVTVIGRRSVGIQNPTVREILHSDYANYAGIGEAFDNQDIAQEIETRLRTALGMDDDESEAEATEEVAEEVAAEGG